MLGYKHKISVIRRFVLFEAITFFIAALIHSGVIIKGYGHYQATIAESIITAVLVLGLVWSILWPAWTRLSGLLVQGFAFLGTVIGVFTIVIGIGPRTLPDVVYHAAILFVLGWGFITTRSYATHEK